MASSAALDIQFRADLGILVARWPGEVSEAELQRDYRQLLAAADLYQCAYWLLDLRRRNDMASPATTTWMNDEFFPLLPGRFPLPVRLAYVLSPQRAASPDPGLHAQHSRQSRPIRLGRFTDEASAYEWLTQ